MLNMGLVHGVRRPTEGMAFTRPGAQARRSAWLQLRAVRGLPAPLAFGMGFVTALSAAVVLMGWWLGSTEAARLVAGWRVMVPASAFCFVCVGAGLAAASTLGPETTKGAWITGGLAVLAATLPILTLFEYSLGTRWLVESWLGVSFTAVPLDPYAGRMSPMTSLTFVLLALALGALASPGQWGASTVRHAGGAVLAMSWLAMSAVSFDVSRLDDVPRFPGMAALTIALFAMSSVGVLSCSAQAVARLRDADAGAVLEPRLLAAAFALPLVLGRLQAVLGGRVDVDLATAVAATAFGTCVTAALWRGAAYMQALRRQRNAVMLDLEARVVDRTRALELANSELQRSEELLRDADRRKDEFLATLAHELRNPLAPMVTGITLLKSDALPSASRRQMHEMITRQMHHMVRLIDDLLDVSRITAGKLTLKIEELTVADVVDQALETARDPIDRAGHSLTVDVPAEPITLKGDATRLTQVVSNLLLNACKYTPPKGAIDLTTRLDGEQVELHVKDNGIGIPPQFLPRLFEKFSQVAAPLDRSGAGLGLGLALVRGIVTLHGGSVEVRSEGEGRGSEFIVRLPVASSPEPLAVLPSSMSPDHAHPSSRARRILIADDNEDNVETLAELLRTEGHVVETVTDGRSAFAAAERFRPDVVLLDIGMPGENGYDVCRRMRRESWGPAMRIIAQTGWGQAEDRRRTREAGFDEHLVKPLNLDALRRLIVEVSVDDTAS